MKNNKRNSLLAAFTILMLSFNAAFSQPSNDDCSGAILITTSAYSDMGGTYTDVNTNAATASSPNPSCVTSNDNNDDVWYKFVAQTQTELLRVHSAVAGSAYVTFGFALYDSCGGTEMMCNNQMGTFHGDQLLGNLTTGKTYYLRFWSLHNFTSMTFSFAVQDINPITPADNSNSPTLLTINSGGYKCISPQFFTTANATRSSPDPSCISTGDNDDDVWFQFTMPAHWVDIYIEQGALINSSAYANMGMEFIDASTGLSSGCLLSSAVGSRTSFGGGAGVNYYIRLWTVGKTDHAVFSICVQDGGNVKPANDSCSVAQELIVGSGSCSSPVIGNLYNSDVTFSLLNNPSCTVNTTLKNDIWYKAKVPASGNITVQTSATNAAVDDLVLIAYTNSCGTFTQISCDEDGNPDVWPSANHAKIALTGRTPGETILYRVLPRNSSNYGQFSICAFDETAAALPELSINDVTKNEGDSGIKKYSFNISLSAPSTQIVKVKYKTVDLTATAPTDYVQVNPTQIIFNPGETLKTVKITVNEDTIAEPDEKFKVKLVSPVNAVITDAIGIGTINNDDGSAFTSHTEIEQAAAGKIISAIHIYPNPATDALNIDLPGSEGAYNIIITDITGRTLKRLSLKGNKAVIAVSSLSSGTYIVTVNSDKESRSFKFVKQ